ncbi:MAG: hypothetical protein CL623_01860 [Arcobacter sp.]|nr:hypothetical protein [Arcobacter sp.]|tara:strand:- start:18716 stop:19303 length:588 start_codon:yes stop_codon:yes gene_type:complete
MKNLITQYTPQLEQDLLALHTGNSQSKQYFYQSVMNILQVPKMSSFQKADAIADAFISLDVRVEYIKEQQKILSNLKKQIETAKSYAKEEVSKALLSLGVEKLEGLKISSLTATGEANKSVAKLEILNEDELIKAGFFTIELDKEAVEQALLSADQRHEVENYADMKIELIHKSATIRINKRKVPLAQDELMVAA